MARTTKQAKEKIMNDDVCKTGADILLQIKLSRAKVCLVVDVSRNPCGNQCYFS